VKTITISEQQYSEAKLRIEKAGLQEQIDIQLIDYRKVEGKYDKVVSVEMIEAVGHEFLPEYFAVRFFSSSILAWPVSYPLLWLVDNWQVIKAKRSCFNTSHHISWSPLWPIPKGRGFHPKVHIPWWLVPKHKLHVPSHAKVITASNWKAWQYWHSLCWNSQAVRLSICTLWHDSHLLVGGGKTSWRTETKYWSSALTNLSFAAGNTISLIAKLDLKLRS